MNGQDILDHFSQRLARLEATGALPVADAVLRLPSPPVDLHSFTSSFQGIPVFFPASWVPSFSDLFSTLYDLLEGNVEVEVFRLQYKEHDGDCAGSPSREAACLQKPLGMCSPDTCVAQALEPWHLEEKSDKRAVCKGYSLHPIPVSSTEIMDFGAFLSESSLLFTAHKSQLLYLTWRSLPDLSIPGSMPEDFCYFIDTVVRPITTPKFIASETIKQRNLWMGGLVTSRIHFDALDNLHVCISGRKIVHLYPPSELPNLYPEPWRKGSLNNFSQIGSAFLANQREHARYYSSKRFRVELNAGEAIFIPAGWWHEVFTLQQTLSVNVWFGPSSNAFLRPTLLHLKSDKYLQFMLTRMD